jgi:hypothetical protein
LTDDSLLPITETILSFDVEEALLLLDFLLVSCTTFTFLSLLPWTFCMPLKLLLLLPVQLLLPGTALKMLLLLLLLLLWMALPKLLEEGFLTTPAATFLPSVFSINTYYLTILINYRNI